MSEENQGTHRQDPADPNQLDQEVETSEQGDVSAPVPAEVQTIGGKDYTVDPDQGRRLVEQPETVEQPDADVGEGDDES